MMRKAHVTTRLLARLVGSIALVAVCCGTAWAQVETVRTPLANGPVVERIGAQYRGAANRAADAAMRGRLAEARQLLLPAVAFCDQLGGNGRVPVSVAVAQEYETFVDTQGDGKPVDWIDIACPNAYKGLAFVEIEEKDSQAALRHLAQAEAMAPYLATLPAERGYLLNQLGRPQEGLQAYRHARALVDRFPSNRFAKALVLRGLGYTQVELGNLDEAERQYRQSLQVDPANALAQRELDYIAGLRAKAAGAAAAATAP